MYRSGQPDARTTAIRTARTIISTFNAGDVQRQTKGAGGSIPSLATMFSVVYSHLPTRAVSVTGYATPISPSLRRGRLRTKADPAPPPQR